MTPPFLEDRGAEIDFSASCVIDGRDGHALAEHQVGGVRVRIAWGHLDQMPRCKACGRAVCSHPDPVFAGVVPPDAHESGVS